MNQDIVGKKVKIVISDPWEFETETGTGTLLAKILKIGERSSGSALLLQVESSIKFRDTRCEYFIASPRLENGAITDVQNDEGMFSNLILIPPNRAMSENPFGLWRGEIGLIATIKTEPMQ